MAQGPVYCGIRRIGGHKRENILFPKKVDSSYPTPRFVLLMTYCKSTCKRNSARVEPRKGVGSGEAIHKGIQNTS